MITEMIDNAPGRISTEATSAPSFSAADYLVGIIQRIVTAQENSRIVLPGKGEVSIIPSRNSYYSTIHNIEEFCQAPAANFLVSELGDAPLPYNPGSERNLGDLLWQAAFYASQGRLVSGCSKYDVVQFRYWPNLSRLPITSNTMRICALLTRHPTTIMLVHRKLGIDNSEIYQVYSAAHCAGVTNMVSRNPQATASEAEAATDNTEPEQPRGLFRSLFAKIAGL